MLSTDSISLVGWCVRAIFTMHFIAGDRRCENAGQMHGFAGPQQVLIMLIQDVDIARFDRPDFTIRQGFYFTFTFDAVNRLVVMLVVDMRLGAFKDPGDMKREAATVFGQYQTCTVPGSRRGCDQALRFACFFKITNDHLALLSILFMHSIHGQRLFTSQPLTIFANQAFQSSHDILDAGLKNIQTLQQILIGNRQRTQALENLTSLATRLDDQALFKRLAGDLVRQFTITQIDPAHQAASTLSRGNALLADPGGYFLETLFNHPALALHITCKGIILPVLSHGLSRCGKGQVEATESTVVLTRLPLIEFRANQHMGKRQTETGKRFGVGDDIGLDAGVLKTEELTGAAAACLDIINNQQNIVSTANLLQALEPLVAGDIDTTLPLHRFDDHCSRNIQATGVIRQQFLEIIQCVGV